MPVMVFDVRACDQQLHVFSYNSVASLSEALPALVEHLPGDGVGVLLRRASVECLDFIAEVDRRRLDAAAATGWECRRGGRLSLLRSRSRARPGSDVTGGPAAAPELMRSLAPQVTLYRGGAARGRLRMGCVLLASALTRRRSGWGRGS
jgi:hypothetical protein